MGSAQSYLPVVGVIVAGAAAYGYAQLNKTPTPVSQAAPSPSAPVSSKKQKQKKKAAGTGAGAPTSDREKEKDAVPAEPSVVSFPPVIPGGFDAPASSEPQAERSKPKKKKKAKKAGTPVPADAQSESSATAPESSVAARTSKPKKEKGGASRPAAGLNDDGWTKVETKKKEKPAKAAGDAAAAAAEGGVQGGHRLEVSTSDFATSVTTGNSSPVTERTEDESQLADSFTSEHRRPLAERLLPKPRKTGVEDLLEEPDHPEVSRVMRVKPRPDERPAAGFSWADYEDVDSRGTADDADGEDDGGWGVVKTRTKQKTNKPASESGPAAQLKASESLTKKQRQHAAKREAEKAAKAEAERERLATLARHKRELEQTRMAEQAKASKKAVSGGMSATVDENGKLVWQ
ncbi:hypothetical protein BD309DRAFT_887829 [Dichomitus squalens]|uniref:Uncharacterized protein n=1 Tax=Dichomitus squalens TaxID=114155 RepID=A0A4V2K8M4_9APHY|nr:uncharacterized protein DICSQDRAFT_54166 [Dichomitus squalens LYAD-421 SS1]EJF64009.1 hypothetical protein DICSQDRAFT_54166 [Dichomitus squalens LYAD-421 SS1]TBU46747.1 hypothetical protein BD309DRAFT_887829 [Dichomitus squalens]TBU60518.1 hypothetical protein BD310DRAFT_922642 [Dichomitus squalens]